jgi:hypothetical protein
MSTELTLEKIAVDNLTVAALGSEFDLCRAQNLFEKLGFTEPTEDPLIKSRGDGEMLAGIGKIDFEGAGEISEPNGCLIYIRSGDALAAARELLKIADLLYPESEPTHVENDFYWFVEEKNQQSMILGVSPKTSGHYLDHVLLFAAANVEPSSVAIAS